MSALEHSPLGRSTGYPERYDPSLLFPITRASQRDALGLSEPLPFTGVDLWTAYEITWLDARGKPCIALGELSIPAASPGIVESKSLKLYLGSFTQEKLALDE
ncbi:MAG TPA: NADPH-dependent 7-cyano-7-deazaguanine reductase QueF, partial [Casimicrobiaceae bacterium]